MAKLLNMVATPHRLECSFCGFRHNTLFCGSWWCLLGQNDYGSNVPRLPWIANPPQRNNARLSGLKSTRIPYFVRKWTSVVMSIVNDENVQFCRTCLKPNGNSGETFSSMTSDTETPNLKEKLKFCVPQLVRNGAKMFSTFRSVFWFVFTMGDVRGMTHKMSAFLSVLQKTQVAAVCGVLL